jgi:Spy/CpxP family protein refolding chaperone
MRHASHVVDLPPRARSRYRIVPLLLLVCLVPGAGFPAGQANDEQDAQTEPASRARIGWQVPAIQETLEIGESQRASLDRALEATLEKRREAVREYALRRSELASAAAVGTREEIPDLLDEVEAAAGRMARIESELVVTVLRILTPEQRRTLEARYPRILQRPWIMGGPARAGGRRRGATPEDRGPPAGRVPRLPRD